MVVWTMELVAGYDDSGRLILMNHHVQAIYEGGVFHPLEPIALPEHQRVTLTIGEASPDLTSGLSSDDSPTSTESADSDERPWRGVFAPERQQATLFSDELEVRTAELPRWEPQVHVNRRWVTDDEE
jgi:predicted DNA-binding antitoxin AbrB/MazE fold protein